jgi:hypothetical protein
VGIAGWKVIEELRKWPTPADLIERIKATEPDEQYQDGIEMMTHCSKCGKWRWCRKELPRHPKPECEDCYTGLDAAGRKKRYHDLMVKMGWVEGRAA